MMRCEGMNHVVGGDQGWDAASDIASWSINKIFTVGDNICEFSFSYSFIYIFFIKSDKSRVRDMHRFGTNSMNT